MSESTSERKWSNAKGSDQSPSIKSTSSSEEGSTHEPSAGGGGYKAGNEKIARSASRVSGATIVSRLLGLARDSIFAAFFGTSYLADAFNIAFLIPNFLRRILGEGMLSASYVPVYTHYLHKEGRESASGLAIRMFSVMIVVLGAVAALGVVFADPILKAYALGWRDSPETFGLTVRLTRILFPYIFFVGLASVAGGTLNSLGYFALPAFAPAFLNIALIASAFTFMQLARGSGEGMIALFSVGALIGGALQVLVQVPRLLKTGLRLRFRPDFRDAGVKWIGRLMVPSLFGFAVTQVNMLVDSLLATMLPEGSVTALRLGNRIAIQPLGIFAVAITTAALPALSEHAAKEDRARLVQDFSFSVRLILACLIPSTVALVVLATPVIRLLFERGEFSATQSTPMTVNALVYYSLGLFAYGGVKSVVQAFYSMKDTMTPMKVSIASVVLNIVLNLILMRFLGLIGLALATSISSAVAFATLVYLLRRRLGGVRGGEIWSAVGKIGAASAAMGVVLALMARAFEPTTATIWGRMAQVFVPGLAGLGALLAVSYYLKVSEVVFILRLIGGRRGLGPQA